MLKLTQGQGRKVKGQGHICNFVKNLFWLYIMNQWLNINDANTHDYFNEMLKLTQGQGHKVKGQGHVSIYVKK